MLAAREQIDHRKATGGLDRVVEIIDADHVREKVVVAFWSVSEEPCHVMKVLPLDDQSGHPTKFGRLERHIRKRLLDVLQRGVVER